MTEKIMVPQVDQNENSRVVNHTYSLMVNSPESLADAQAYFIQIRAKRKEVEDRFDPPIKGMNAQLKNMRLALAGFVDPLKKAESWLSGQVITYQQKERQKANLAQQKEVEKFTSKVGKAVEKGKDPANIPPPKLIPIPAKSVRTDEGMATTRKVKKARLTHFPLANTDSKPDIYYTDPEAKELPLILFKLDWVKLGGIARSGGDLTGVESYEDEILTGRK